MRGSARHTASTNESSKWLSLISAVVSLSICILILLQGGFFSTSVNACGLLCIIAGVVFLLKRPPEDWRGLAVPGLFALIALCGVASSIVNGLTLTTLSEVGIWAATAGLSLLATLQTEDERGRSIELIAWFGILTGFLGLLGYADLFPVFGGVVEGRLQFTFQYANATGIWYAICTVLCLLDPSQRLFELVVLPATALLLTESGGAALAFLLVTLWLCISFAKSGRWHTLLRLVIVGIVTVACFFLMRFSDGLIQILAAFASVAFCAGLRFAFSRVKLDDKKCQKLALSLLGVACCVVLASLVLRWERVAQASGDLVERFYQIHDGLLLWSRNVLFGVGPDNWKYHYRYVQTAQYTSTVIHSSYMLVLLDTGIVGFAAFLMACFVGLRRLWAQIHNGMRWAEASMLCVAMILGHCLIDFDLKFGSILFLLAFFVSGHIAQVQEEGKAKKSALRIVPATVLVACAATCAVSFLCEISTTALNMAYVSGDYEVCCQLVEDNPLAHNDKEAIEQYLGSCVAMEDYERAASLYKRIDSPTDNCTVYGFISLCAMGDETSASRALVGQMQLQPYNVPLFINAVQLVDTYGLDESMVDGYNAAVDRANMLADQAGEHLVGQQHFDRYVIPSQELAGQKGEGE